VNLYPALDNHQTETARALANDLARVGLNIEHDTQEYGAYLEKARLAATSAEDAGWHINVHEGSQWNDVSGYLAEYRTDNGRNAGHWGTPDLDAAIRASEGILDVETRVEAVKAIQRTIAEEAWAPGTLLPVEMYAWIAGLRNFGAGPEWSIGYRSLIDAWLEG
jgi:ABC-type transport system substrate-binding protein